MNETLLAGVIGGMFAVTAALSAVAVQSCQARKEKIASEKKRIIEALISYRFVLTAGRKNDPLPTMRFNAALSAIPVQFSNSKDCMDKYRSIGNSFTSEKYYELIIALMKDVPLDASVIDKHLLENVPSVTPKIGT